MKQEEIEKKLEAEPPLAYAIRGMKVSDGEFYTDAALAFSREDIAKESKGFIKYKLYKLEVDKNQNL